MTNPYRNINELREWLKANSGGVYRPADHAATVIGEQESELITLRAENAELRAKLAAMESQEVPADKPAVAVPDGWKMVPVEPTAVMVIAGEDAWDVQLDKRLSAKGNKEAFATYPSEETHELCSRVAYRAMLSASPAPSHSQQSAATDAVRFCDANCTWLDHHPDCPSHEIEQPDPDSEGE